MATPSGQWLFESGGSLRERVLRGGFWAVGAELATQGAGFLRLVVLARLLAPHDFGLMGIALVLMKWLEYFTETHFSAALVRKPEDIRPYLDTAWTLQVVRGVTLASILALAAPLAAAGLGERAATPIIRGAALVLLFQSFVSPSVLYLRRELDFRRDTLWKLSAVTAGVTTAIVFGFLVRNAWALVLGLVASEGVAAALSYVIQPYRPRFAFDRARARELMQFGKWMFWVRVTTFLCLYLDTLAIARLLGATALGFYQAASQLAVTPATRLVTVVGGVMYPTFARLQEAPGLRRAVVRMLGVVSAVLIPLTCFVIVFATPLVTLILGAQWLVIVGPLQVLACSSAVAPVSATVHTLLQAVGKPELSARISFVRMMLLAVLLYPLVTALGTLGGALAVTFSNVGAAAYSVAMLGRVLPRPGVELLGAFRLAALGSVPLLIAWCFAQPTPSPALFLLAAMTAAASAAIVGTGLKSHLALGLTAANADRA
jgi:lipopolysaccharide exporter